MVGTREDARPGIIPREACVESPAQITTAPVILARGVPIAGGIAPDLEHDRPTAHFAILDIALRIGAGVDRDGDAFAAIGTRHAHAGIRVHPPPSTPPATASAPSPRGNARAARSPCPRTPASPGTAAPRRTSPPRRCPRCRPRPRARNRRGRRDQSREQLRAGADRLRGRERIGDAVLARHRRHQLHHALRALGRGRLGS